MRPLNGRYLSEPPGFSLPSLSGLVSVSRWWPSCYFTKLDISAYFHSLSLLPQSLHRLTPPNTHNHPFVFQYRGISWVWLRLPFGWSWAPALAQRQMTTFVHNSLASFPDVLGLVYYDDVLLASPDPSRLRDATQGLVAHLHAQNLRVSLRKCLLEPSTSTDWLGKHITQNSISNTTSRIRQLAGVIMGICRCRSVRSLRRLLGWVSWYASHFHGSSRALSPCYASLYQPLNNGLSWSALWSFAFTLALGSCTVSWSRDTPVMHILYTDACARNQTVGVCTHDGSVGVTCGVPQKIIHEYARPQDAQQTCELFGVALAVTHAALSQHNTLIFTDSSACCGWFSGCALPPTRTQSHLLLASSLLQTLCSVDCSIRWVSGKANPADTWSRVPLNRAPSGSPPGRVCHL